VARLIQRSVKHDRIGKKHKFCLALFDGAAGRVVKSRGKSATALRYRDQTLSQGEGEFYEKKEHPVSKGSTSSDTRGSCRVSASMGQKPQMPAGEQECAKETTEGK